MSSTGNKFPASGTSVPRGTNTDWANPGEIVSDNTVDAICTDAGGTGSDYLVASNFSLGVPANAVILGVTVRIEASEHTSGTEVLTAQLQDDTAALTGSTKTNTISGTTKAVYTYGTASDVWGASLTPAIVNDTDFGVRFWFTTTHEVRADYVTLAVEWAIPAGVGGIAISGKQVAAQLNSNLAAAVGALAVTGQTPTVSVASATGTIYWANFQVPYSTVTSVAALSGSLVLTGQTPAVGGSFVVPAGQAALDLAGGWPWLSPYYGPTLWDSITDWDDGNTDWDSGIPAGKATLLLSGKAPEVDISGIRRVNPASLSLAGARPTKSVSDNSIAAGQLGTLTIDGQAPSASFTDNRTAEAQAGLLAIDGKDPSVSFTDHRIAAAGNADLVIAGATPAPSYTDHRVAAAGVGELVITGALPASVLGGNLTVSAGAGSLTIVANFPDLIPYYGPTIWDSITDWDDGTTDWDAGLPAGAGDLRLTGKQPQVDISGIARAGAASLVLTATTPIKVLSDHISVAAGSASLAIGGGNPVLGAEVARISWANFAAPAAPGPITISAGSASLMLAGKNASIPLSVQAGVGSLVIAGQTAVSLPSHDIDVFAASDFVTLTWQAVTGATGYKIGMDVDSGAPYAQEIVVGNVTEYTVGPQEGTYYFNVLAYNGGDGPWNTELVWTSGGLHLAGSTPDVVLGGNVVKSPAQADLQISGGQVTAISPLMVDALVGSLVITSTQPTTVLTAGVQKSPDAASLEIGGQLPATSWTDAKYVSVDVAALVIDGILPSLLMGGSFTVGVPAANLYLEGAYATIPTAQVYPYPGAAGRPSKGRGRPKKQRRWILPNGVHVYADADQAFELAQLVTDQPVEIRTQKPKRPVIIKADDGGYTEAAVVYPVERFGQSQATETYAAQTQVASTPAITYEVVARMLQAQKRRQRAAAILLLT